MPEITMLATVALLAELPEKPLVRGQVGTVVEVLAPGVFQVEFSDEEGRTYAVAALRQGQLLPLLHAPVPAAA